MTRQAYTSTVIGTAQFVLGLGAAAVVAVIAGSDGALWWVTLLVTLVMVATALHLSTVRLAVRNGRICVGQGPWNRPARLIPSEAVVAADTLELGWAQSFGFGVPLRRKTTRLTVSAGPALYLVLDTGEHLRISTPDPDAVRVLLKVKREENHAP